MRDEVKKIPGLRVIGDPGLCICSFTSDEFDIYAVLSEMRKHGWTMGAMQFPPAVHLDITHLTTQNGVLENYLSVSQKFFYKNIRTTNDGRSKTLQFEFYRPSGMWLEN